ncbi:MAG TPA: NUDIX domain-containing protein [Pyrinomonadaceae bacterium]
MWRGSPAGVRRLGVWLAEPRFTVTAGAVVVDDEGRVLLLKHVYRRGSGWGIPGGFMEKGEQPEAAIRRELREEAGLEVDDARLVAVRSITAAQQVEILYAARARRGARACAASAEVSRAAWFGRDALPPGLSQDQRRLIALALESGARRAE